MRCLLFCAVAFGCYGAVVSRWAGINLRLSSGTINYDKSNMRVQYGSVTVVNPSAQTVKIRVQPSCGCVVVINHPDQMAPFVPYLVKIELHSDSLIAKPGYQQNVEFQCQSGEQRWIETIEVKPKEQS